MAVAYYSALGDNAITVVKVGSAGEQSCIDSGLIKMVSDNEDKTMTAQADGTWVSDLNKNVERFTDITTNFIQDVLDNYNDEFGLKIKDVARAELYSRKTGYTHQAFCLAIWDWSVDVWEAIRAIPIIPTDAEFEAVIRGVNITDVDLQARVTATDMDFD